MDLFILTMDEYIVNNCDKIRKIYDIFGFILKLIQYFAPLILIIWAIIIGIKKMVTKNKENVSKRVIKKLVLAVFMFFLPLFISIIIGLVMPSSFRDCVSRYKCCDFKTNK